MTSLLLSLSLSAAAGQRQIAVLDVEARPGVSASVASSLTDALVIEARRAFGSGAVIGTDDVRQMLHFTDEKRKLGCLEVECLAELGGALGVQKLLVAGVVGTLQVTSFWSLRAQSASPGASIPISQGESAQANAQWGAPLSVAGYCAAAALAGSGVLTW